MFDFDIVGGGGGGVGGSVVWRQLQNDKKLNQLLSVQLCVCVCVCVSL